MNSLQNINGFFLAALATIAVLGFVAVVLVSAVAIDGIIGRRHRIRLKGEMMERQSGIKWERQSDGTWDATVLRKA